MAPLIQVGPLARTDSDTFFGSFLAAPGAPRDQAPPWRTGSRVTLARNRKGMRISATSASGAQKIRSQELPDPLSPLLAAGRSQIGELARRWPVCVQSIWRPTLVDGLPFEAGVECTAWRGTRLGGTGIFDGL